MADNETIYTIDARVRGMNLYSFESEEYQNAWHTLLTTKIDFFGLHTREKLRLLNSAYAHWHMLTEDLERKYLAQKGFGEK